MSAYNGNALKVWAKVNGDVSDYSDYTEIWYFAKGIGLVKSDWASDYSDPGWIFGNVQLQSYTVSSVLFLLGGGVRAAMSVRRRNGLKRRIPN